MDAAAGGMLRDQRRKSIDAQTVLPVVFAGLLITGAFAILNLSLIRTAQRHRDATAVRVFQRAEAAREQGRVQEALELFRRALNENPSNAAYRLAFAQTLRSLGRVQEAQAHVERVIALHPAHGGANAEMARLLAARGEWQNAAWYYHRALYGEWTGEPNLRALRFELAELLANHGARDELLAEVVLLTTAPLGPSESRKLAGLLLAAQDWPRAERQYRSLLRTDPDDVELLTGLARAQMGAGKYLAAERSFRRAVHAGGSGRFSAQRDLDLITTVNSLNPAARGIGGVEKHRRAHELTARMVAALRNCSSNNTLIRDAEASLARHQRIRDVHAAAETDLDFFEQLWQARNKLCPASVVLPKELELLGQELSR